MNSKKATLVGFRIPCFKSSPTPRIPGLGVPRPLAQEGVLEELGAAEGAEPDAPTAEDAATRALAAGEVGQTVSWLGQN